MTTNEIISADYRYYAVDLLTNTVLVEIPFVDVTYGRALSKAGSFSGSIPVVEANAHLNLYENTMPGKTAIYILRNGVCVWGGIIWSRSYSPIDKELTVDGAEFISYLYHRMVWQTLYYGSEPYYCSKYQAASGTATVYTSTDHEFEVGDVVKVYALNNALNGTHVITAIPSASSFSFASTETLLLSPSDIGQARSVVDSYDVARDILGWLNEDFVTNNFLNDEAYGDRRINFPATDEEYTVTNKLCVSDVVTLTLNKVHDLIVGQLVEIAAVDDLLDGYQTITAIPSSTTVTYNIAISSTVTNKQLTSDVATLTLLEPNLFAVGDAITVSGVDATFNGTYTITSVPTPFTIRYSKVATNVASTASAGTVIRTPINISTAAVTPYTSYDVTSKSISTTTLPITFKAVSSNIATITTASAHGLAVGDYVSIAKLANNVSESKTASASAASTTLTVTSDTNLVAGMLVSIAGGKLSANTIVEKIVGTTVTLNKPTVAAISSETVTFVAQSVLNGTTNVLSIPTATTFTIPVDSTDIGTTAVDANTGEASYKTVTLTTSTNHGIVSGTSIIVENIGSDYDGNFVVASAPDVKTIKYTVFSTLNYVTTGVSGGTVSWGGRLVAGTYGSYSSNSDIGIDSTAELSAKYLGSSNKVFRGSDLRSFGDILEDFTKELEGFEYRIDCDFENDSFTRTFTFVPFVDPPVRIPVTFKQLTSNIATITTSTAHGLVAGDETVITDVGSSFDGTVTVVSAPTATTFTFYSYNNNVPSTASTGYIGVVHPLSVLGADQYVFEYPGNIFQFTLNENAEDSATRMWVGGSADGLDGTASQPYAAAASKDLLNQGWPLLDEIEEKNDVDTVAAGKEALYNYALDFLGESRPPEASFNIEVNGSLDPVVGSYYPGDWCSIILDDEFVRMRLATDLEPRGDVIVRKIIAYTVGVPETPSFPEKVTLTLQTEWKEDRKNV
jgi:hypothetical protein